MGWLDRIHACQRFDPAAYRPFRVAGRPVGHVTHDFAERLRRRSDVFIVGDAAVTLVPELTNPESRTEAVEAAARTVIDDAIRDRWRDEPYPVAARFNDPPLFTLDRALVPLFGVRAYGVHVNGYVRRGSEIAMWIGRRSPTKSVAPGKLDQMVAGGQPAGLSLADNLRKEAAEEAGLSAEVTDRAVPVGAISYRTEYEDGLRNDVLFLYDLEMPEALTPVNTDGELLHFMLWPLEQVAAVARETEDFKFNCSLVVADFLIRHGRIRPDEPDYLDLIAGLHSA